MKYRDPITGDFKEIFIKVSDTLPVGAICQYGGNTAPSGYLMCNGQAESRTDYAELFAAIGTTFGSGDGLTTFNVPNFNGRVPVGLDGIDTDFDTLGETGGSKELQEHSHTLYGYHYTSSGGTEGGHTSGENITDAQYSTNTAGTGDSGNLQPYLVTNFIIKASNKVALDRGNVVDVASNSNTDAYSCDYSNEHFGGQVLWTNPNPNQAFSPQTISNIDLSDYDCIEIYYKQSLTTLIQSMKMGTNGSLSLFAFDYVDGSGDCIVVRSTTVQSSSIVFQHAYALGVGTNVNAGEKDDRVIPVKIIGYKTGLL